MSDPFTEADLGTLAALLRDAGRSEVMPRFRDLGQDGVRTKSGPLDLVTDADEAAERLITAGLHARFPGCLVVGEEATAADPGLPARIGGAALSFVVDPIDGTANYAAGMPLFAVMGAALRGGQVVGAAIHDPVTDETFLARAGGGAWCRAASGARALAVSAPAPFGAMTGTVSWRFLPEPRRSLTLRGALGLAGLWDFRCAGHQYRLLAAGQMHFSFYNRLLPWDHAPGWLIHREAGGYSARFDGSAYTPLEHGGGLICAPDRASWNALHEALL